MLMVVMLVHCPLIVMIARLAEVAFRIGLGGRFPVIAAAASTADHITGTGARCDVDHILLVGARRRQRGGQFRMLG